MLEFENASPEFVGRALSSLDSTVIATSDDLCRSIELILQLDKISSDPIIVAKIPTIVTDIWTKYLHLIKRNISLFHNSNDKFHRPLTDILTTLNAYAESGLHMLTVECKIDNASFALKLKYLCFICQRLSVTLFAGNHIALDSDQVSVSKTLLLAFLGLVKAKTVKSVDQTDLLPLLDKGEELLLKTFPTFTLPILYKTLCEIRPAMRKFQGSMLSVGSVAWLGYVTICALFIDKATESSNLNGVEYIGDVVHMAARALQGTCCKYVGLLDDSVIVSSIDSIVKALLKLSDLSVLITVQTQLLSSAMTCLDNTVLSMICLRYMHHMPYAMQWSICSVVTQVIQTLRQTSPHTNLPDPCYRFMRRLIDFLDDPSMYELLEHTCNRILDGMLQMGSAWDCQLLSAMPQKILQAYLQKSPPAVLETITTANAASCFVLSAKATSHIQAMVHYIDVVTFSINKSRRGVKRDSRGNELSVCRLSVVYSMLRCLEAGASCAQCGTSELLRYAQTLATFVKTATEQCSSMSPNATEIFEAIQVLSSAICGTFLLKSAGTIDKTNIETAKECFAALLSATKTSTAPWKLLALFARMVKSFGLALKSDMRPFCQELIDKQAIGLVQALSKNRTFSLKTQACVAVTPQAIQHVVTTVVNDAC